MIYLLKMRLSTVDKCITYNHITEIPVCEFFASFLSFNIIIHAFNAIHNWKQDHQKKGIDHLISFGKETSQSDLYRAFFYSYLAAFNLDLGKFYACLVFVEQAELKLNSIKYTTIIDGDLITRLKELKSACLRQIK
jgi:hypothetical protein